MPTMPPTFRATGAPTARQVDRERGSSRERGYTTAWDKASRRHRDEHPLCAYCLAGAFGRKRAWPATRVDHLYPQRRYADVFWRREWWVSSCDDCDADKQSLERQGKPALDDLARRMDRPTLDLTGA